jgi:hypothetical protein
MNPPTTGYYSLVQYCPDRSRLEAANVGVLLFAPAHRFLQVRLAQGNDRIRRFFQDEAGDLTQVNLMKRMLEHRVEDEADGIRTPGELQHFLTRFANELIFSAPRPVRVENPEVELTQLYEDLVGGGRIRRDVSTDVDLVETLRVRFETAEFAQKVRGKTRVRVPVLGDELVADYAFQNGRLNLVQAKEFTQQRVSDVMREAMKIAVDGHLLFKHPDPQAGPQQLVIVGAFGPAAQEQQQKIEGMLADHEVTLYSAETLDRLVQRIRETAH